MPILRSRKAQTFPKFLLVVGILAPFWFEEITTGKTGNTRSLRSGHKINWFLAFETLPVFPVVIFSIVSGQRTKGWPPSGNPPILRIGLRLHSKRNDRRHEIHNFGIQPSCTRTPGMVARRILRPMLFSARILRH